MTWLEPAWGCPLDPWAMQSDVGFHLGLSWAYVRGFVEWKIATLTIPSVYTDIQSNVVYRRQSLRQFQQGKLLRVHIQNVPTSSFSEEEGFTC
jgi:hypothetical protein